MSEALTHEQAEAVRELFFQCEGRRFPFVLDGALWVFADDQLTLHHYVDGIILGTAHIPVLSGDYLDSRIVEPHPVAAQALRRGR